MLGGLLGGRATVGGVSSAALAVAIAAGTSMFIGAGGCRAIVVGLAATVGVGLRPAASRVTGGLTIPPSVVMSSNQSFVGTGFAWVSGGAAEFSPEIGVDVAREDETNTRGASVGVGADGVATLARATVVGGACGMEKISPSESRTVYQPTSPMTTSAPRSAIHIPGPGVGLLKVEREDSLANAGCGPRFRAVEVGFRPGRDGRGRREGGRSVSWPK